MATTTYKTAGVDIKAGAKAIDRCKKAIIKTHGPNVLCGIGAFGGGILLPDGKTVLIQSMDGVGTKIKLAIAAGDCSTVGADLVHHSVNDILAQGAKAKTFLDYFAAAQLDIEQMSQTVIGAAEACERQGIAMIGGETAEMPGFYYPDVFDLAGCITGMVDLGKIITGKNIRAGDILIGLGSDGLHTNGYSLLRKILENSNLSVGDIAPWNPSATVGSEVLRIHRCYENPIRPMINAGVVKGIAHITGGGIPGNLIRILPRGHQARVDFSSWKKTPIFEWLQRASGNKLSEMLRTFNMGIGIIVVVRKEDSSDVLNFFSKAPSGESAYIIGEIAKGRRTVEVA